MLCYRLLIVFVNSAGRVWAVSGSTRQSLPRAAVVAADEAGTDSVRIASRRH